MKFIILLIFCGIIIEQCVGKDHGHHHGHGHHGHDHGHHGHDHGHHGHDHGHHDHGHHHGHGHHHEDADEHGHFHDENQAAKFRYSKQANKQAKKAHHEEPVVAKQQQEEEAHGHAHSHGHGHGHEDGHSHSHGGDHGHDEGHAHEHDHSHGHKTQKQKDPVYWLEPLLATAMISAAPFLILFFVPLSNNSPESKPFLKVLLSFASGGLLGDAFLHLIPHAISPHSHTGEDGDHSHGHSHSHGGEEGGHDHTGDMLVGLWVLAGIIAFLVVEKFVRFLKGGHGHSHGHSHAVEVPAPKIEAKEAESDGEETEKANGEVKKAEEANGDVKENGEANGEVKADDDSEEPEVEEIKVAAYLNLAADCTHNFTDGLAIGASFLVSRNVGLITTLTIFLHEIPHEIGDFAILVQSGCTKRKAMLLQLVTAIGAFAGCICGLLAEGLGTAASAWILPFTAGGFIYIATVSVIPELLEESKLGQSIKEIIALLVGVFLMVIIALTE